MRDYAAIALKYARDVVSRKLATCVWVKAACARHLDDLTRAQRDKDYPFYFEPVAGARVCAYIERLRHVKGIWARNREHLVLGPWQVFIIMCVFGWLRKENNFRRFIVVYEEIPRKNAKTTKLAGIGLYMLTADGEIGAEVYSAATTRGQAKIVFNIARQMAELDSGLRERFALIPYTHHLITPREGGRFEPLSSDAHTLDGLNISCGLIDELHAHKTRQVYDVMDTGTGSRGQPLIWSITTAGVSASGICYEVHQYTKRVLNATLYQHPELCPEPKGDAVEDDTFFGIIYTIDKEDDPFDPRVWGKANPNLGVSVMLDDLKRKSIVAQRIKSARNKFLTKHLDVWVGASFAWLNLAAWERCREAVDWSEWEGEPAKIGLDLASKIDIAAKALLFWRDVDGARHYWVRMSYYLPEARVEDNENYAMWAEADGLLNLSPGEVIDFRVIEQHVLEDAERYELAEVGYDPAQATHLVNNLQGAGLTTIEIRPSTLNFSEPMKELEAAILSGRFHHDGDPVLAWMAGNVSAKEDVKGNIYPRKESDAAKIDGVVALLVALRCVMLSGEAENIYETRGVI